MEETKEKIDEKIFLCEGVYTIKDFHALWIKDKKVAKRIFYYKEFEVWLRKLKFPFMHFFEQFLKDINKERAISNFFALNNLNDEIGLNIKIDNSSNKLIITKNGEGFLEEQIKSSSPLITFSQNYITNRDFENGNIKEVSYFIDQRKAAKVEYANIYVGSSFAEIKLEKKDFLEIKLLSNYKDDKETMQILITNNSEEEIPIEIESNNIAKFVKHKYIIGNKPVLIDFTIDLPPLLMAKKTLGKALIFEENIRIHSRFENRRFYKDVSITIGDLISQ